MSNMSGNTLSKDVLIATTNTKKAKEIILTLQKSNAFFEYKFFTLQDKLFQVTKAPEETGSTFFENAKIKSTFYLNLFQGINIIAEDSGLCIEELDGAPGVLSARWVSHGDYTSAFERIERSLRGNGSKAFFVSAVSAYMNGSYVEASGTVAGDVTFPPAGDGGFGYDPIFKPHGHDQTFAEMSQQEKLEVSHRKMAVQNLIANF